MILRKLLNPICRSAERPESGSAGQPARPGSPIPAQAGGTYQALRRVRKAQLLCAAMLAVPLVVLLIAALSSADADMPPGRTAAGFAAIVAAGAFSASLALLQLRLPVGQQDKPISETAGAYLSPSLLAVGLNAGAMLVTAIATFWAGLRGGVWVLLLAAMLLNGAGVILAWPRMKRLRRLIPHNILPLAR